MAWNVEKRGKIVNHERIFDKMTSSTLLVLCVDTTSLGSSCGMWVILYCRECCACLYGLSVWWVKDQNIIIRHRSDRIGLLLSLFFVLRHWQKKPKQINAVYWRQTTTIITANKQINSLNNRITQCWCVRSTTSKILRYENERKYSKKKGISSHFAFVLKNVKHIQCTQWLG